MTLKVTLTIEPHGDKNRAFDIADIEIGNITRGVGRMSSDYIWRINTLDKANKPIHAEGYLVDSINGSAVELLHEVLIEWKSGRKLPIDNHGQVGLPEGINYDVKTLWNKIDKVRKK